MTMMSAGGLMVTSNFANFARDFGVADILVLGLAALPFALTVDHKRRAEVDFTRLPPSNTGAKRRIRLSRKD